MYILSEDRPIGRGGWEVYSEEMVMQIEGTINDYYIRRSYWARKVNNRRETFRQLIRMSIGYHRHI